MTNKPSKPMGAPKAWDSMAGFLPVFIGVMVVLLVGLFVLKGYIG